MDSLIRPVTNFFVAHPYISILVAIIYIGFTILGIFTLRSDGSSDPVKPVLTPFLGLYLIAFVVFWGYIAPTKLVPHLKLMFIPEYGSIIAFILISISGIVLLFLTLVAPFIICGLFLGVLLVNASIWEFGILKVFKKGPSSSRDATPITNTPRSEQSSQSNRKKHVSPPGKDLSKASSDRFTHLSDDQLREFIDSAKLERESYYDLHDRDETDREIFEQAGDDYLDASIELDRRRKS